MRCDGATRVLYLSVHAELGGAERTVLNLLRYHDRRKVQPLLCVFREGRLAREAKALEAPTWVIPAARFRNAINNWRVTAAVRQIIRQEGVDIVHSVMAMGHLYGTLARVGTRAKGVWFQQMNVETPTLLDRLAALAPASWTFVNSMASVEAQRRFRNWTGGISVVYLGVDLGEFSPNRVQDGEQFRRVLGIPEGHRVVGMAGRIQPWKGQHVFLEAAELVSRKFPKTIFLIVGDALFGLDEDYKRGLEESVEERGLSHLVRFVGFHEDMAPVYASMDIAVHASITPEPFGLVIVEAMAMARPVVASDGGGPREIVLDGITGWLTPMGDPASLAERIGRLLQDAELRERMGEEGRRRVEELFSMEQMVLAVEQTYANLMHT